MSPARMEKIESASRGVLMYIEAFNRHDLAGMGVFLSETCTLEHFAPTANTSRIQGLAEIMQIWQAFFAQHPQAHFRIDEVIGSGLRCVLRGKLEWHTETQAHSIPAVGIFQVQNSKIHEQLFYWTG